MYKKCTFGVQKVYSLLFFVYKKCTFGVQKVYSLIFFVYRRCTIYVQQYIFLYFGMYKNVQRFLYKLVHCRKIQHNRLYIVLFFVTWLVHCTVPGCTFQTVHFTRKNSVQVMYNACTKSVQPEKKVYSLCTFRVPKMYNQKKKVYSLCTFRVPKVYWLNIWMYIWMYRKCTQMYWKGGPIWQKKRSHSCRGLQILQISAVSELVVLDGLKE